MSLLFRAFSPSMPKNSPWNTLLSRIHTRLTTGFEELAHGAVLSPRGHEIDSFTVVFEVTAHSALTGSRVAAEIVADVDRCTA